MYEFDSWTTELLSAAKVVQHDVVVFNTQILEHLDTGGIHHGWAAEVVFTVFRSRMVLEIVLIKLIVDEAGHTLPVILRLRVGECDMPDEIIVLFLKLIVLFSVEHLPLGACTIPERHF